MMLVYLEFVSRRPGVGLHEFRSVVAGGQSGWSGDHGTDIAILNVGRTWRIGPEPEYLTAWYNAEAGLGRLDDWNDVFTSGTADAYEEPFRLAARIDRAGCYEPLVEPIRGTTGRYLAEWFDPAPDATRNDLVAFFDERKARHGFELNLLIERIGLLGPDPRGLAVWSLPSFGAMEAIARDLDGLIEPVVPVTATLYADLGQEQL
jgi:hypothetical protein